MTSGLILPRHGSNLGQVPGETGQLVEAEAAFRHALLLKPHHAEGHNNFGILLGRTGHYAHAEAALKKALELNAKYAAAHNNLGHLLSGIGRFAEAEPALFRALELNPDYVDARFNLSLLLLATGRYAEDSKEEKRRIKGLEKELQRKEKALAEAAALLVLRKKVQAIWGEQEDD
ncbi:Tfp pilus assembly protein PilF [Paraburkholderia sp. JPY681]|nr:Tfp pilus assembly protein PilF [Paraburkholderia atlantica]